MAAKRKELNFGIYYWMQNLQNYVKTNYAEVLLLFAYLWDRIHFHKQRFFNHSTMAAAIGGVNADRVYHYLKKLADLGLVKKRQCLVDGVRKLEIEFDYDALRKLLHCRSEQRKEIDLSPCLEKVLNVWNECGNLPKHRKNNTKVLKRAEKSLALLLSKGYTLNQIFLSIRNYDYLLGLKLSDFNSSLPGYRVGLDEFLGGFSSVTKNRMKKANVELNLNSWFEECLHSREMLAIKWAKSFAQFSEQEKQIIIEWKDWWKDRVKAKGSDADWLFLARDWFVIVKKRHPLLREEPYELHPTTRWTWRFDVIVRNDSYLNSIASDPRKLRFHLNKIMDKVYEIEGYKDWLE